jgi:hypothetical protein
MSLQKLRAVGLALTVTCVSLAGDPNKPAADDPKSLMRVVREGDELLAKFGVKAAKLTAPDGEFNIEGAKVVRVSQDDGRIIVYATLRRASKPVTAYYFRDEAEAIEKLEAASQAARLAFRNAGDMGAAKERARLRREADLAEHDEKTVKQAIRTAADARKASYEKVDLEIVVNKAYDMVHWSRLKELSGRVHVLETAPLESREFDVVLATGTPGIVRSEKRPLELPPAIGRIKCEWVGELKKK